MSTRKKTSKKPAKKAAKTKPGKKVSKPKAIKIEASFDSDDVIEDLIERYDDVLAIDDREALHALAIQVRRDFSDRQFAQSRAAVMTDQYGGDVQVALEKACQELNRIDGITERFDRAANIMGETTEMRVYLDKTRRLYSLLSRQVGAEHGAELPDQTLERLLSELQAYRAMGNKFLQGARVVINPATGEAGVEPRPPSNVPREPVPESARTPDPWEELAMLRQELANVRSMLVEERARPKAPAPDAPSADSAPETVADGEWLPGMLEHAVSLVYDYPNEPVKRVKALRDKYNLTLAGAKALDDEALANWKGEQGADDDDEEEIEEEEEEIDDDDA